MKFQFHIGTIKRKDRVVTIPRQFLFQFHIGTIKSNLRNSRLLIDRHFNSTLVRLKARKLGVQSINFCKFQFHIGTIKSRPLYKGYSTLPTFQFHIGTIKRKMAKRFLDTGFIFQFHIGTIKSSCGASLQGTDA